jgi:hypothetical protein
MSDDPVSGTQAAPEIDYNHAELPPSGPRYAADDNRLARLRETVENPAKPGWFRKDAW